MQYISWNDFSPIVGTDWEHCNTAACAPAYQCGSALLPMPDPAAAVAEAIAHMRDPAEIQSSTFESQKRVRRSWLSFRLLGRGFKALSQGHRYNRTWGQREADVNISFNFFSFFLHPEIPCD